MDINEKVAMTRFWLQATLTGMLDDDNEFSIKAEAVEDRITFLVKVAPGEVGKLVGKQGRTARALRVLLCARAGKEKMKYSLDIAEREDDGSAS